MTALDRRLSSPVALKALGLRGRSFTKELDVTIKQWRGLLDLARTLKAERSQGIQYQRLGEMNLALIFATTSTRTRCAFEVAAHEQGAHVTYLGPADFQLGLEESVEDTGRALGRTFDGIGYRCSSQESGERLARASGVPVWNGMTDEWNPTQSLGDVLTMLEHSDKPAHEISFAYCGDARTGTASSLLVAGAMMGMDVRMVAPRSLRTPDSVAAIAVEIAGRTGASVLETDDVAAGVAGVDFLYTNGWLPTGEPKTAWDGRIALLSDFQVNAGTIALTGNPGVKFMHCLPALHDQDTEVGRQVHARTGRTSLEVADDVFESKGSIVFDQAENRMHAIKALLVATLEGC